MRGKFLSVLLTIAMMLTMVPTAFATSGENAPAQNVKTIYVNEKSGDDNNSGTAEETPVKTLAKAVELAGDGDTVQLLSNVTLSTTQIINESITLDLNQSTITNVTAKKNTLELKNGTIKIMNGTISSQKDAVYLYGDTVQVSLKGLKLIGDQNGLDAYHSEKVVIDDCEIATTDPKSAAIDTYECGDVQITNSTIKAASESGKALSLYFKYQDTIKLGEGNTVIGVSTLPGQTGTPYTVEVTGGCFNSGEHLPFKHANNNVAALLDRLHITGGHFTTDVTDLLRTDAQCVLSDSSVEGYKYTVIPYEGTVTDFYTSDASLKKTYYDTLEAAVAAGKQMNTMVYVIGETTITDPTILSGAMLTTRLSGKLTYAGTLSDFLASGTVLKNADVQCNDVEIISAETEKSKLVGGTIAASSQWDAASDLLREDALIYAAGANMGKIGLQSKDKFAAKIGYKGYFTLKNALSAACENDTAPDSQVKDEIVLLESKALTMSEYITHPNSSFTIDLNGHTLSGVGFSITLNTSVAEEKANHADITLKNGKITSDESYGIAINGLLSGVKLELINLNVSSTCEGAGAVYLASGTTTITGGSYVGETGIQLCSGSLTVDNASVTATGLDNSAGKDGDGIIPDGSAISVVNREGYVSDGVPQLTIKSGEFVSQAGIDAVKAYSWKNDSSSKWEEAADNVTVSGGQFSSSVDVDYLDDTLKAEVYNPSENADAPYSYYSSVEEAKKETGADGVIKDLSQQNPSEEKYTLTLKYYDGKEETFIGTTFVLPSNPTRSGYTFLGWYNGDKEISGEVRLTDNMTLTAHWSLNIPSYSGGVSMYPITVEKTVHGSAVLSTNSATKGTTVTVTVTPDKGYVLSDLTVTDKNGNALTLTDKGNGKYTFVMPEGAVTVKASFGPESLPFTDVSVDAYYANAVKWAVDKGVTSGLTATTFGPNESCTRAQMVTFLWRAAGSPVVNYAMKFTDVPVGAYYAEAVRWAVSKGITAGLTETTFGPEQTVTRGQVVAFLYRQAGSPAVGSKNPFTDVASDAYYADAVKWAVAQKITAGTTDTTFSPNADCTRGQIVTFLYNDMAK